MILLEIFLTFDGILKEFILCAFIIWVVCYIIYALFQEAYNKIFKKKIVYDASIVILLMLLLVGMTVGINVLSINTKQ